MRRVLVALSGFALVCAFGVGTAAADGSNGHGHGNGGTNGGGNHGQAPPNGCPVQSPAGGAAAAMGDTVFAPCGWAVGVLGVCPPNSPQGGQEGPPCGNGNGDGNGGGSSSGGEDTGGGTGGGTSGGTGGGTGGGGTHPTSGCGESNPPTGLVSGPAFGVGVALGGASSGLGRTVEDIACALFNDLGL